MTTVSPPNPNTPQPLTPSSAAMKRTWPIWIAFAACLAVLGAAMAWISVGAWRLDRAETEARRQAALEENVRLALWRLDSALAPLSAQESVRPYFAYKPFLPIDRPYGAMFNDRGGGEMLVPSPLLAERPPGVLVHFQFEPDGELTSPQVPTGTNLELAVPNHVEQRVVGECRHRLERVAALVDRAGLLARLPPSRPLSVAMIESPLGTTPEDRLARRLERDDAQRRGRGAVEFIERNQAVQQSANVVAQTQQHLQFNAPLPMGAPSLPPTDLSGVQMTPLWIDGQLLLARRIAAGGQEYVQGCLLDWPAIRQSLLDTISDLLPEADLHPVDDESPREEARMVAALPLRLVPGRPAGDDASQGKPSPMLLTLAVAWACMLLAAVAVAGLVAGVVRLSERRATFVGAVTHELRTPLTTFQIYAEMLAEGMVNDPDQQQQYLATLSAEARRLTHLVENVLAYARLERGRVDGRVETIALGQLLEPMRGRLATRAEQAGMTLDVHPHEAVAAVAVRANAAAVEQILLNLVDNACKYAGEADDGRIHLEAARNGRRVELRVRDHGPGLSHAARRRLFTAFGKSAREAAHSAPGVGLGLALSRRLARDMGGELRLDAGIDDGACFVLALAVSPQ